ncbi:MAG: tetratricopeptide repeat protein [Pseudomonadales bacterium]|nr:tetratricopeptide repeat protein [Pseudomonadales bacterium]
MSALVTLMLAACSHSEPRSEYSIPRHATGKTLGDLKRVDITLHTQSLESVSVSKVISTYTQALSLFSKPEERHAILKRMADLTMVGTEEKLLAEISSDETEEPSATPENAQDIASKSPQVAIDITAQATPTPSAVDENLTYITAIKIYEQIIAKAEPGTDLSEIHYLLAKAYDLDAMPEKSLATLNTLVMEYPKSRYIYEAQFRRGEQLFLLTDYEGASDAYQTIITAGSGTPFYEQSLYKHGWAQYKLSDYDFAIHDFVALMDIYRPTPKPKPAEEESPSSDASETAPTTDNVVATYLPKDEAEGPPVKELTKTQQKVMTDALRVTALAFSNLEGSESVKAYFEERGIRIYEVNIYNTLASLYLFQERFRDAANTYEAFSTVHPLHPKAPSMASKVIETFLKGGFPSLVLPYKERFVKNYGLYSRYWKQATPEARSLYEADLQQHLVELAHHYHAVAQGDKKAKSYMTAARWYREYLATFPHNKAAPEMNKLLAETLFSAKEFQSAVEEFERTAYEYPSSEDSSKAGYFALLSYQELIKTLKDSDPTKRGWIAKKTSSSLQFAKTFPAHKQTPSILDGVIEDQLAINDINGAITTSELLIKLMPPPPQKLWQKAWLTLANAKFDLELFPEAEDALTKVLGFTGLSRKQQSNLHDRRATAVYKQAEALDKAGKLREAAAGYLRVALIEPTAKIRATAEYDAANILLKLEDWDKAIDVLEHFRKSYPRHKLISTLPAKLSLAYEKAGNWAKAARELEVIAAKNMESNPDIAQEALWQAAKLVDTGGDTSESIRLYKKYVWAFEKPLPLRTEGQFRLAELYGDTGDDRKRSFWLNKLVQSYKNGGSENTDRTQYLAAFASNELARPLFNTFNRMKLKQPLKRSLKKKKAAMKVATKAYGRVAGIGILEFTTAANYQIGEIYRLFAQSILESERPRGLDDETLEEYELLLEDQALPIEDKAIEIFIANADRTKDGIWDEWVQKSYKSLSKLQPGRFAKHEIREESVDAIY